MEKKITKQLTSPTVIAGLYLKYENFVRYNLMLFSLG